MNAGQIGTITVPPAAGMLTQPSSPREFPLEASLGLGVLFGGTYDVSGDVDADVDSDPGFFLKTTVDYFPIEYLGVGMYLSFAATELEDGLGDLDMIEFGPAVKGRLSLPRVIGTADLLVTPGLSIGYRRQFVDSPVDDIDALGVNFGVDFRLRWNRHIDVFFEPGFISQPAGGNSDVDVEASPIPYLLFGAGYAF